jgi:hypothetical protein
MKLNRIATIHRTCLANVHRTTAPHIHQISALSLTQIRFARGPFGQGPTFSRRSCNALGGEVIRVAAGIRWATDPMQVVSSMAQLSARLHHTHGLLKT